MDGRQLQVPTTLLSKTRLQNRDTITSKNTFEVVGGNSFIEIEPAIARFAGYELNRDNILTIRVINKAPIPQRLHILPPNSAFFSIKVDKKGILSTGMGETIQLHFVPTQYRYYDQVLKINTETENFLVPIHAYPVLSSSNLRELLPKHIDFGNVDVRASETNTYPLTSKVPLNFEFEFVTVKSHPSITVSPAAGVIPGKGSVQVAITFAPTIKATAVAELQLKVAQFDFQPLSIRVVGTGKQPDKKKSTTIRVKPGSAEQRNKEPRSQTPLDKQPLGTNTQQLGQGTLKRGRSSMRQSSHQQTLKPLTMLSNANDSKLQNSQLANADSPRKHAERQFLDRFNEVQGLDKEKDIKFFIYNGDKPMSEEEIAAFQQTRQTTKAERLVKLQEKCNNCHQVQINNGQCTIQRDKLPNLQPKYNADKNDELGKRRKLLKRLMAAGSKILVRNRMVGRLEKIKHFLRGCTSREEVALKVQQEAHSADERMTSGQDYVKFEFQMSVSTFDASTFPLQFQESGPISGKTLDVKASTEFDDIKEVALLQQNEIDMMGYLPATVPQGLINLPKEAPPLRASAEEEYPFRGPCLPVIEPIKRSLVMELPLALPPHIFIAEDTEIRRFKKQCAYDEKDIEFLFENTDPVEDALVGWSGGDRQVLKAKFMRNLGCEYLTESGFVNAEMDVDVGNYDRVQKYCPRQLQEQQPDDPFSDADSDNDDYPQVAVAKLEDTLKKVEGDNKQLQEKRAAPKPVNDYRRNLDRMEKKAQQLKRKMLATPITTVNQYNKWTTKPTMRMYV